MLGVDDVWVELNGEVVDSGTYSLAQDTLILNLASKSFPILYEWEEDGAGELELKQVGADNTLFAEILKN